MTGADALAAFLDRARDGAGARVAAWRFELATGETVRVGCRAGALGDPYDAPAAAARVGGALELRWSDGLVTRANLGREALDDLPGALAGWRAEAVAVELAAPVAPPAPCPAVETADPSVAALADGDAGRIIDLALEASRRMAERGVPGADVTVAAGAGRRHVRTSAGFDLAWDETTFALELSAEELHGAAFSKRRLPADAERANLADEVAAVVGMLRTADALPPTARGVLLEPPVADALLGRFLLGNLDGRAVLAGQSRFSLGDLERGAAVLRSDLDLLVDTTLPFEPATAPCSPEGVPAGRVALIRGGRLASLLLDRERGARLGRPPTPAPRGRPAAVLASSEPALARDAALALLGDGAVVRTVLGLHTQAARRGEYAVVAPEAHVVRAGRPGGRCAIRLRGNLFEQLAATTTRLVRCRDSATPGLLVLDGIDARPG